VLGSEIGGDGIVCDAEHTIGVTKGGGGCGDSENGGQGVYVALNVRSASGRGVGDVVGGEVGGDAMNVALNARSALCRGWGTWWVCCRSPCRRRPHPRHHRRPHPRRRRRPRPSSLSWAMTWHIERGRVQVLGVPGLTLGHAVER